MLDKENAQLLENNVLERLDKMYPDGDSLAKTISKVAMRAAIITLQEYEKMCKNQESES